MSPKKNNSSTKEKASRVKLSKRNNKANNRPNRLRKMRMNLIRVNLGNR